MLALISTIDLALSIFWWIVILSAVFSWLYAFNVVNPSNQFVGMIGNALYRMTEPVLGPIRRVLPDLGGIDIFADRAPAGDLLPPPVALDDNCPGGDLNPDVAMVRLIEPSGEGCRLLVRLTPKSSRDGLDGIDTLADGEDCS